MSENSTLLKRTSNGMMWKFLEKISSQGMQLIIQIVLARLLLPEEYGLIGLLSIFITISDVFILQGLTTALIQKKNADDLDYSSVYFANILISLFLYVILFLTAPVIADFYKESALIGIMRVLSLNVVIGAFPAVHNAILSRNLDFKKSFFRNISNAITQGIVGISLALCGAGAWAMVFSKISGNIVGALVLCATVKWSPRLMLDFGRLKHLFSYSSKVLATNLLNTVFNNINSLIIGRYYSTLDIGYYQRGQQIPQGAMSALDGSMSEVLYPAFSKCQDDLVALKKAVRKSISFSMYIVLPVLTGLIAIAKPFTLLLLTEKWLPSVPYMQLTCIGCMFWPLSHRNHAINALGKSNVTLRLSIIGKSISVISIVICLPYGINMIMVGSIVSSLINVGISSYYVKKYLRYTYKELILDLLPSMILSGIMFGCVLLIGMLKIYVIVKLVLQIVVGIVVYLLLSSIFKPEPYKMIMNKIVELLKRKK